MLHLKQTAPGGTETAKIDLLLDWFDSMFVSGAVRATRITHSAKSKGISKMLASHITTGAAAATETIELHQNSAPFPPEKWNCHDAIVSANHRSDNLLEGSYWTIKHLIGQCCHLIKTTVPKGKGRVKDAISHLFVGVKLNHGCMFSQPLKWNKIFFLPSWINIFGSSSPVLYYGIIQSSLTEKWVGDI